jgi:chloramphenicol-sensitive protein RarD
LKTRAGDLPQNQAHDRRTRLGTWVAIAAYGIWGLFPIYWKWLQQISPLQLVAHRIIWTWLILFCVIFLTRQGPSFLSVFKRTEALRIYLVAALLMGVNWLVFTMAVNSGQVTQAGLGYYISPLINASLGIVLLHERLRFWQVVSLLLAVAGVVFLTLSRGALPWMALALAFSFGTYGLVKKLAPLGAIHGLMLETTFLAPPALLFLADCAFSGEGAFIRAGITPTVLMIISGFVSMSPLLLFSFAAQRITLTRLGILQYITPTMQLFLGVTMYHETLNRGSWAGFAMIWMALLIYGLDGVRRTNA